MKIIRQRDWKDCGVCSLASIIEFYGGKVSLEQLRLDTKTTKDGATALNIINASKKYGFDAMGLRISSLEEINILPAIAHMNLKNGMNHFVVIYKITSKKVILMDPKKGKVVIDKKDFYEEWSKVVLVFYPHQKIPVLKNDNTLLSIFGKILFMEKNLIFLIVIVTTLLTIFTIAGGYYFQIFANAINYHWDSLYIKIICLVFGVFLLFKLILNYYRTYLENHLSKNVDAVLNTDFLNHLYHLPLNVLTSRTAGEIVTRVGELSNIKSLVTEILITSSLDFFLMMASIPLLLSISNKLFLILFLALLLYLLVGTISSKMIYNKAYQNIEYEAEFNSTLIEDIKMIYSIKNLNLTDSWLNRLEEKLVKFLYDTYSFNHFLNKDKSIKNAISEICYFLVTTIGFLLVLNNDISIVQLVTFNTLLNLFFDPLKNIVDSLPKYNFLKATITKINDFLSINKEVLGKKQNLLKGEITIKNLDYSYDSCHNILSNFNLNIKNGEMVLFDGKSGSGKSTLCKIIDKYITDYNGDVVIDGTNIKDLSLNTIRENILYVCQNESLFTGTIKENILLDKDDSRKKFEQVCNICGVDDLVSQKPLRYETIINDDGANISGGERQRIILARALLKKCKILIMDEALSEVDYKLERKILTNIRNSFKDITIIYITHKKHHNLFDQVIKFGGYNELL